MKPLRHPLLALLVLLQLLVPYLHSHASPGSATGLHVHLPSLQAAAQRGALGEAAAVAPRPTVPAGSDSLGPVGESPALEMPVEWRGDQLLCVVLGAGCSLVGVPPLDAGELVVLRCGESDVVARARFSVMAYPAAAPPARSTKS